jgi:hypothetical protein
MLQMVGCDPAPAMYAVAASTNHINATPSAPGYKRPEIK